MNSKTKISLAAAIILAAVLIYFWWPVGKSEDAAPSIAPTAKLPVRPAEKLSAAPLPAKPTTAALPMTPPSSAAAVAGVAPMGDPRAEIGTAIDDIINLLQSSEILEFYEKYTAPADKAKWSPGQRDEYARQDAMVKANPSADGRTESLIGGFESLKGQTPKMNAAGDEATFQFTMQPPPGMDAPPRVTPMVMVKVDGKWYLKM